MEYYKVKLKLERENTRQYNANTIKTPSDIVAMLNTIEGYTDLANETIILIM